VLADTGAGGSIFFQRNLVHNVRNMEMPYGVMGVGGNVIVVNKEGDSEFGVVGYHNRAGMNILSIGELLDRCVSVELSKEKNALTLQMKEGGPLYIFNKVNNQFICDLRRNVISEDVNSVYNVFVGVVTVEDRMKIFTWAEIRRAEEARALQQRLGYPSAGQLIRQIQQGKLETRVTPTDVINSVYIWGKSLGECKGKTTARKPLPEEPVPIPFPGARAFQTAHMDLMFDSGLCYLIIVFRPLDYVFVGLVKSRKGSDIWVQMRRGIREVINRGFMISVGYFDGEKAIGSEDLQHLVWLTFYFELDIKGQGKAVPVVEAKIRRVKEKMRAVVNTVPYVLDLKLAQCLTKYAALRVNGEVSIRSVDGLTPRERLYGRRNDKAWIRHGFGDYVQVHDEYTSNKMKGRTQGALALYPTGNLSGTWKYLNLSTWKEIRRNGATPLPMPNEVIEYINSVTRKKKARLEFLKEFVEDGDPELLPEDIVAAELPEIVNPVADDMGDEGGIGEIDNNLGTQQQEVTTPSGDTPVIRDSPVQDNLDSSNEDEEMVDSEVIDEIISDYRDYNRADGEESDLERSRRMTQELLMRDMLAVPVKVFVGLGLQMELSEARSKYGVRAVRVAAEEIKQVLKKGVFSGITLEEMLSYEQKPIPSSMKVKEKMKGGLLEKLKGRLAAGGHRQNKAFFANIKYAPTVSNTAVMIGAAVAAAKGHAVASIDFTGAFLYAVMPTDKIRAVLMRLGQFLTRILVKLDPSYQRFVQPDGTCVVILKRALYGTIQAAAAWYNTIIADMKKLNYEVSKYDNCVVYRKENGKQLTLFMHVDDFLFDSAGGEVAIDKAIDEIKGLGYEVTVHRGRKLRYLGADFDFSVLGEVSISMTDYVDNAVKTFEDKHGTVAIQRVPAGESIFKVSKDGYLCGEKTSEYASHVMRGQFLAKHCRYDTVFTISVLNKRMKTPTEKDWNDLVKYIGYIKGSRDMKLTLKAGKNIDVVTGYIDASFGVHDDLKGHGGCVILVGDAPVYVKSSASKLNTKSSTEEELCRMHDDSAMVLYAKHFMEEVYCKQERAVIKQDNMSSMDLIYEGRSKALSTKHIDRRYFYVKDLIERGEVRVVYCRTDMMLADIFTKALMRFYFERLCVSLMNRGNKKLKPLARRLRGILKKKTNLVKGDVSEKKTVRIIV
jgi:Reverse transcriptase (RNA-dependent DNA polymerase)